MEQFKDEDVVKVKFNFAAYISEEENPFDPEVIYAENNLAKGNSRTIMMLGQPNMIDAGQTVELYWKKAKQYVQAKKECFFHSNGLGVSDASDPRWVREIPIAQLVA